MLYCVVALGLGYVDDEKGSGRTAFICSVHKAVEMVTKNGYVANTMRVPKMSTRYAGQATHHIQWSTGRPRCFLVSSFVALAT